jgi:putative two-component system response regulator
MNANSKPTVLVVDDAPESIDVLRSVLGSDYQIKAAISGELALRIVERTPPDLILLDVIMPDLNGYEVCRRLKGNPQTAGIPVMFVTNLAEATNEAQGLSAGAVDYITKPFVPALVRSRVHTQLTLHDQNRMLERKVAKRTAELVETRLQIIQRLGRAAEYRDNETGLHVIRMSHYSRLIARAGGMSEDEAELVLHAAPMHDIGKIGVPDRVLLKPGSLVPAEWEVMKQHTTIGAEIIGAHVSELLEAARIVALNHHEYWNGMGYPAGLRGEEIPKIARAVALGDVFDALTSARPYKAAWSVEAAVSIIEQGSGIQFDPQLVPAFLEVLPECLRVREQYSEG